MYERFTDRARKVMQLANQEAQRFNHEYIGTEHILLGLIKEGSGVAANVLKNLEVDLRKIRLEVEKLVQSGPDMVTMGKLPQTPRAKKVIEYSMEEARKSGAITTSVRSTSCWGYCASRRGWRPRCLMKSRAENLKRFARRFLSLLGHGLEGAEGSERAGSPRWPPRPARPARPSGPASRRPPALGQLRPRPDRVGTPREARSGDRSREGNRTGRCRSSAGGPKNNPVLLGRGGASARRPSSRGLPSAS